MDVLVLLHQGTIGKSNQSTQNNDNNEHLVSKTGDEEVTEDVEGDEEDKELIEDQAALDWWQELTGDPLPAMVQIYNLENQIYQCAPGENNTPKYLLLDDDFEVLAFPNLFPYGRGAYHSECRPMKLPIHKYFQQRLLNADGQFAKNIEYLFCAQNICDLKQIQVMLI